MYEVTFKVRPIQDNIGQYIEVSIFLATILVSVTKHNMEDNIEECIPLLVTNAKKVMNRADELQGILNGAATGLNKMREKYEEEDKDAKN